MKLVFGSSLILTDAAVGFHAFGLVQSIPRAPRATLWSKPYVSWLPQKDLSEQLDLSLRGTQVPIFKGKSFGYPTPLIDFLCQSATVAGIDFKEIYGFMTMNWHVVSALIHHVQFIGILQEHWLAWIH